MLVVAGLAVAALFTWIALTTVWLWRNQERVVFQPPRIEIDAPMKAKRLEFKSGDGHELFGYLVAPSQEASVNTVVIAFHGNADLAAWLVPWAQELADRATVAVFVPEYRGYAGIRGVPSYETAASDANGALDFVVAEIRPARTVLFGHSLGTAIAADLAVLRAPVTPDVLVLQSPFTSAREMAARMMVPPIPWLWRRISRVHYDTRAVVARLECPVWVAHGTRDVVVPMRMGRQVFAAARHQGELLIVEGAGHNDVADVGGETYWKWLTAAVTDRARVAGDVPRRSAAL